MLKYLAYPFLCFLKRWLKSRSETEIASALSSPISARRKFVDSKLFKMFPNRQKLFLQKIIKPTTGMGHHGWHTFEPVQKRVLTMGMAHFYQFCRLSEQKLYEKILKTFKKQLNTNINL